MPSKVIIIDYGSQVTQLIARRVREAGVYSEIHSCITTAAQVAAMKPSAIILSGGPASVGESDAPALDPGFLDLGVPVLGICYGMQLLAQNLGGQLAQSLTREYGPSDLTLAAPCALWEGIESTSRVWMSHGDKVLVPPAGFTVTGKTPTLDVAAMADEARKIYAVQFHPEVHHSVDGERMLRNFLFKVAGIKPDWTMSSFVERVVAEMAEQVGDRHVVCALSGGIDSALVATIAVDALGKDRVFGVTLPSVVTSNETYSDALDLARRLGIPCLKIPIAPAVDALSGMLAPACAEVDWANPLPGTLPEENLQARIRGVLVMALSNRFGHMVVTTGNKSEMATGYATLYGDMAGGFALIKDVPKTLVFELARWRNGRGEVIPPSTISRPPSAELKPGQLDSDSLPPYDVLDPILELYVERQAGIADVLAAGFDEATVRRVARLVDRSEYKRRQGAPGVKITPKAFGRDRRMPITNGFRE